MLEVHGDLKETADTSILTPSLSSWPVKQPIQEEATEGRGTRLPGKEGSAGRNPCSPTGDRGFWLGTVKLLRWKETSYSKGHAGLVTEVLSKMPRQLLNIYERACAQDKVCVESSPSARTLPTPILRRHQPRPEL